MVRTLHRAGLEVILDVVYNHTGEGNQMGPTLSLQGSTTTSTTGSPPRTRATTSTTRAPGNSLNVLHPRTMGLVTDSLRYWVTDMHVDGFRFDLAPVLSGATRRASPAPSSRSSSRTRCSRRSS